MSKMLEQAMVDAVALREAAMKKAETTLIEKYSESIKEAVETILEEPEEFGDEGEFTDTEEPSIEAQPAFVDDEPLCPCAEEDEEIEIDFDQLRQAMEAEEEFETGEEEIEPEDVGIEDEGEEEMFEEKEKEEGQELDEEVEIEIEDEEDVEIGDEILEGCESEEEEEITEDVEVDYEPQPSGKMADHALGGDQKIEEEEKDLVSKTVDDEKSEEIDELNKTIKKLEEELKSSSVKNSELSESVKKVVEQLKESNFLNAKLLYKNRILESVSLNERQRVKIVEAIEKSESIEEAKTIFETLLKTVETSTENRSSMTLNEVVTRNSSASMPRRKVDRGEASPYRSRMQALAGISEG